MPEPMLLHLRHVFGESSPFWSQHGYHKEGCGFFSYVHSLEAGLAEASTMDAVVRRVWQVARAAFPAAAEATKAEWWAHCRRGLLTRSHVSST